MAARTALQRRWLLGLYAALVTSGCILPEYTADEPNPAVPDYSSGGGISYSPGGSPNASTTDPSQLECDPVNPSAPLSGFGACSYGQTCQVMVGSNNYCTAPGPLPVGSDCNSDSDCGPGMACDEDYDYVCNYWCYDLSNCPSGSYNCYLTGYVTNNGMQLGLCEW